MTDIASAPSVGLSLAFGEALRRDRKNRAPDVLNTIANLSSDEVFTPPELANRMLDTLAEAWAADHDGASIWADSDVTFLDPAVKSGVFLREITKRLVEGQGDPPEGSDERKALVDRVLGKQVFGIGMTVLTAMLSRRSIYCSKDAMSKHSVAPSFTNPDGNIWFQRTEHTWVGDRCAYCPATREGYERGDKSETYAYAFLHHTNPRALTAQLFGGSMNFDVIVGNPPYQLDDGGAGKSAAPIYQKFIQAAKALKPQYLTMVTPSRWMAGGKGLDDFRAEMLSDDRIRSLTDYIDSDEAFPGVDIAGGVSYFLWSRDYRGTCTVTTIVRGNRSMPTERRLNEFDVFVRHSDAISILHKIWPDGPKEDLALAGKVSGRKAFGYATTARGALTSKGIANPVTLVSSGGEGFVARAEVSMNADWIDKWKATVSRAAPAGGRPDKEGRYYGLSSIRITPPGFVTTEAYPVVGAFDSEAEAARMCAYLKSRFVRFLLSLRAANQSVTRSSFAFVPDLPMDRVWTDEALYEKYGISPEERAYIELLVRPMDLGMSTAREEK